jgi:hypothetical protein
MPRPTGRTPTPEAEKQLQARVKELEHKNAKLQTQLQAADDMMAVAGEIIRSLRGLPPKKDSASRSPRRKTRTADSSSKSARHSSSSTPHEQPRSAKSESDSESEDPEPPSNETILRQAIQRLTTSTEIGRAARALGVDTSTLRRWIGRLGRNEPLIKRRGGIRAAVSAETANQIRTHVRALRGLVGAASLARTVTGVSRRSAAVIKRETLAELERERQDECRRVEITTPGVMRGFDAMFVEGQTALVAADAAVPFRTSITAVEHYDAESVARALARDFELHGAPLVWRRDRARCQAADPVASVLEHYGVIALQGPAHYPQFYGQLERQNREHQAWLDGISVVDDACLEAMRTALNALWRRPTLGWRTSQEVWDARPLLDDERDAFTDDVRARADHLVARVGEDLAMRLAIEQALTDRGLLSITPGRRLLRE